eukprot:Gb_11258 [translate_table: standard]
MEMMSLESCSTFNLQPYASFRLQNAGSTRRAASVLSAGNWRQHQQQLQRCNIQALQYNRRASHQIRLPEFSISCSSQNRGCNHSEEGCNSEEALDLKEKAEEIVLDLDGTCIFFVGMMGSGKTTVGKILSEALGYYFFDSDKLVEQAAGGTSVAQIFKEKNEEFFRDAESKVLSQLSSMHRLVVATGGGAVVRQENWSYMKRGITIWLDVPLEALAKRVVAVGTESRPLLGHSSVDSHSQAFARLTELIEKRGEAYANSDAKVSLQKIAAELGYEDVSTVTPTVIAIEVLKELGKILRCKKQMNVAVGAKGKAYKYTRQF